MYTYNHLPSHGVAGVASVLASVYRRVCGECARRSFSVGAGWPVGVTAAVGRGTHGL